MVHRRSSSIVGWFAAATVLSICLFVKPVLADLSMETETARFVKPGHYELSAAFEFQHSSQGEEYALPLAFEWGITEKLNLLIEPVALARIRDPQSKANTGIGDTEVTLQYLLLDEKKLMPAIAGAAEVRIPTAHNAVIGSKVADYRIYLIASKRVEDFDFHFNVGYNIIGAPLGARTRNPIDVEFAVEWFAHPKFDLFAEVNYVDSSRGSNGITAGANAVRPFATGGAILAKEVAGTEWLVTGGIRYHLRENLDVYTSITHDQHDATLFRTGITWKF